MRLTANGISCVRGGRALYDGLSFSVGAGELLLLTGPNGSGKTSLLRQIAGLLPLDDGAIACEGFERADETHFIGHLAAIKGYHVAGKTGTTTDATLADGAVENGNVASFIGFAPANDPKIIVLVKLDYREDRLGGQFSAPVFARITPSILAYLGAQPDGPQLVTTQ